MTNVVRMVTILAVFLPTLAHAAGYDTPMLYSARHMGMGGTAIGSVDDPSSMFHNPAGLSLSGKGSVMLDVSPLLGQIHGSPDDAKRSIGSNTAASPFFFVGGAYNVWDRIHVGVAAYVLGGAAGSYSYDFSHLGNSIHSEDAAKLSFIEVTPTLSVRILDHLRFGASWRATITSFDRTRTDVSNGGEPIINLDLKMKGTGLTGFRLGLQGDIGPVDLGVVYRSKVQVDVKADSVTYSSAEFLNATYQFILPAKIGLGAHWRINEIARVALDLEYIFNSQNDVVYLSGTQVIAGQSAQVNVPNKTDWIDSFTARIGGALKVSKPVELRAGYIYDTRAANTRYPTAFGSPPGPTQTGTLGVGYQFSPAFDMSFAAAARYGSATITDAQSPHDEVKKESPFSGAPGDYSILLIGMYLDARYRFGIVDAPHPEHAEPTLPAPTPEPAPAPAPMPAPEPAPTNPPDTTPPTP